MSPTGTRHHQAVIPARVPANLPARAMTPRWCSRLLGRPVQAVEILDDRSGTTRRTRALLHLAEGTRLAVFVKRPARSPIARGLVALPRLSRAEVGFYSQLAAQVPLPVPGCHAARHGPAGGFAVMLEDLQAAGATMRSTGDAVPPDEVAELAGGLADMHRQWWGRADRAGWLTKNPTRELRLGAGLSRPLCALGLRRAGDIVPEALHEPLRTYAANRRRAAAAMSCGPATLIHNDCHPGNQFTGADGRQGLLDWQLVRAGSWARDVAYLLALSLSTDDRRRCERSLLADYLARLGADAPCRDEAWLAYRRQVVYALEAMLVTLAVKVMMPEADTRTLLGRAVAAAEDLQSFEALADSAL